MRVSPSRVLLLLVVAAMTLGPLAACEKTNIRYSFGGTDKAYEADVGEEVDLEFARYNYPRGGCSCADPAERVEKMQTDLSGITFTVKPADGAKVDSRGRFTATKPGTYTVTATGPDGSATTVVTVAEDGETTVEPSEDTIDYSAILGTWEYPIRQPGWDPAESWKPVVNTLTERIAFSVSATGTLTATRQGYPVAVTFDGTTVTVVSGSAMGAPTFTGVVAGDTITGQITYPGGDEAVVFDASSATKSRTEHLTMAWSAKRVE